MSHAFFIKSIMLFSWIFSFSGFYDIRFTTIEGNIRQMQNFQGKKILVLVLPCTITANDSLFLKRIDSVGIHYQNTLSVIAVPSYEDGYSSKKKDSLTMFYRSILHHSITITDGLYTAKSSGNSQHDLFKWLTHKEKNIHFDIDVTGTGQKFFINEKGELYGVFGPEAKLSDKLMQRMMQ